MAEQKKPSAAPAPSPAAATTKPKQPPRTDDEKHYKFRELANARGVRLLRLYKQLSNLSNRKSYVYTEEEVKALFAKIDEARNIARMRFEGKRDQKQLSIF